MPDNRDPVLSPVPIHSLRPTQITVGLIEVEARRKRWDELSHRKAEYLGQHMIPVVIGPKHRPYVIEALEDEGQKNVLIQPIAHLEKLSQEHFWRFLDNQGLLHPFDEHGDRQPYSAIPKKIAELRDDPFRSLAGAVRKAGGYSKEARPFTEFIWADYFRREFRARDIRHHWARTLEEAVALAHRGDAHFMPGWCGVDS